jgi:hypothetical protein
MLFVGNTRGVSRPIVRAFQPGGSAPERDRRGLGAARPAGRSPQHRQPAAAGQRYRRALAVLNDHHQAMADYGYLNNRVFDVLACGVPVITDAAPGCPPELEPAVIRHAPGSDARASLEQARALRESGLTPERSGSPGARAPQF